MRARQAGLASLLFCMVASAADAAPPANDDCGSAVAIGTLPFVTSIDTSSATGALTDPVLFCNENNFGRASRNVWYSYTAGSAPVFLDVRTTGSTFNTILAVHKGTCASPVTIDC